MTARVVFALTSTGRDVFSAMTRIAVCSLRLSNPGVRLVVACDSESDAAMSQVQDPLLREVDEWLVVPTPAGAPSFRNRFARIRLRTALQGPFLFLDSDVLVRGDLSELFHLDVDVAAVTNHSRPAVSEQMWSKDAEILEAMKWTTGPDVYLNAGVMFINDTRAAREFCEDWHRRWLLSSAAFPPQWDQPAMNSAIHATQPRVAVLPARFNAQFRNNIGAVRDAVVWHYYWSMGRAPDTQFELAAQALVGGASLKAATAAAMMASPHPWRRSTPIDDVAAARIVARSRFDGWEARWLHREVWATVRRHASRAVSSLTRR